MERDTILSRRCTTRRNGAAWHGNVLVMIACVEKRSRCWTLKVSRSGIAVEREPAAIQGVEICSRNRQSCRSVVVIQSDVVDWSTARWNHDRIDSAFLLPATISIAAPANAIARTWAATRVLNDVHTGL